MSAQGFTEYQRARVKFVGSLCLMWFLLMWGLGYMFASKLPGTDPLPFSLAWLFLPAGFFPVLLFGASGMLVGFLGKYLEEQFEIPDGKGVSPLAWPCRAQIHNNPWLLGLNRLILWWLPVSAFATLVLWLTFSHGISRSLLALMLGASCAALVAVVAFTSSGRPFLHEAHLSAAQRRWTGTLPCYLMWRHGIPWGLGNGAINAVLAIPLFPVEPGGNPDLAPALQVSIDTFATAIILCLFMALSAHPHALVDRRLGIIAPGKVGAPTWGVRIAVLAAASSGVGLFTGLGLAALGIEALSLPAFILFKTIAATLIAGAAAMLIAFWAIHQPDATASTADENISTHGGASP